MSERSAGRSALPSDRLPATDFDSDRFTAENLSFWIPLLVELGAMTRNSRVLDVGCGTGGFAIAIAEKTGAEVVGCDLSSSFLDYARRKSAGACTVEWVVGNAERLPLDAASFDCVRMSLVLHQVANKARAVADAFRVLKRPGVLLVRTVLPDDAAARIPWRFVPPLAEMQAAQIPSLDELLRWVRSAGFDEIARRRVCRNQQLQLEQLEAHFRKEVLFRYPFVTDEELEDGVRRMRASSRRSPQVWVDPRPTHFIIAKER